MSDYEKDRLKEIWCAARGMYSKDPSNLSNIDSFIVPINEGERNLIRRIGFVLRAKIVYDHGFDYHDDSLEDWISTLEGAEIEAARMIQNYVIEKDRNPRTMIFNLHSLAQEELVDQLSGIYP